MKSECVDYRELPGQNPLFLAYLYDFERVRSFYNPYPRTTDEWRRRVDSVLARAHFGRRELLDLLRPFNEAIGCGEEASKNLAKLDSSNTVAVLTGQQVGFLGGPSYSVYKAATAIRIAQFLEELGYTAVPIFWLAADDSDFDEVRTTHFLDHKSDLFSLTYADPRSRAEQMAGTAVFDGVAEFHRTLQEALRAGPGRGEVLDLLSTSYRSGHTFREAFARWISSLFKESGLVVFDPLLPTYRRHLFDFYQLAIEKREALVARSFERRAELERSGFGPQVWFDESETFLFLVDGESRYKLEAHDGYLRAKGRKSLRFKPQELLERVVDESVVLGPNVLLRPILQDHLFPTAVSVAGPSEIAYYSQVNAIAPFWDLEMAVVPRAAFTIVDRRSRRYLERYRLEIRNVLSDGPQELTERILRCGQASGVLDHFDRLRGELEREFEQLGREISRLDPTVSEMLGNASEKMFYQLDKVNSRFVSNQHDRQGHLRRHLQHLRHHLLPRDHLQERVLNFNYFVAEEGRQLLDRIIENVHLFAVCHRLLYLE